MVNPENETIEVDQSLNTDFRWWIELYYESEEEDYLHAGEYYMTMCHDWDLDCGGETAEEAIEVLYDLVLAKYGDY